MKRKIKNTLNAPKQITSDIPYIRCFEEGGMFESSPGEYSKAYVINNIDPEKAADFNYELVTNRFGSLLNTIPESMRVQFIIHNRLIPVDTFLERVLRSADKEDAVNDWIEKYNDNIRENVGIGHNNIKKNKYFVISVRAATPDDALEEFRHIEKEIKASFNAIYGIGIEVLSAVGRLKVMYSMFNPKGRDFGKKADLHGEGFNFKDMKRLRLTTKDCIAPSAWEHREKTYMSFDNTTYVRSFFIQNLPPRLSGNLIFDITNVCSNMIFSAVYEPVDAKYGFEAASKKVLDNRVIKETLKRDTLKDRKERVHIQSETMIVESEQAYLDNAALDTLKTSVARGDKAFLASFIIVLYAEDIETLERDTRLLSLSTSKFGCQVRCLDLQQKEGFQSVLPFAQAKVDVKRLMSNEKLSSIPPLNIQEVLQKDGLFAGLNQINDNLVLLNRKNNPSMSGIIAGTEHSGKTYQNKREIFNALISTNDKVFIISDTDEYDAFVAQLGGMCVSDCKADPNECIDHYGLINPDEYSKSLMLDAMQAGVLISGEPDSIEEYAKRTGQIPDDNRLILLKTMSLTDKVIMMDHLWNKSIKDKMNNISTWVFIDSVDELITSEECAAFLLDYIEKTDAIKNVLTMVIQSSVKLFTDRQAVFRIEDVIRNVGYHKLLNQGAIERRKYTEILNIPNTLVNYITGAELGKGIILTTANNTAFDDNFYSEEEAEDTFYKLFKL